MTNNGSINPSAEPPPVKLSLMEQATAILWSVEQETETNCTDGTNESKLREALALLDGHPYQLTAMRLLARFYQNDRQFEQAEQVLAEALRAAEASFGILDSKTGSLRLHLGEVFACSGLSGRPDPTSVRKQSAQFYRPEILRVNKQYGPGQAAVLKMELADLLCAHDGKREGGVLYGEAMAVLDLYAGITGGEYVGHAARAHGIFCLETNRIRATREHFCEALQCLGGSHYLSSWLQNQIRRCDETMHEQVMVASRNR